MTILRLLADLGVTLCVWGETHSIIFTVAILWILFSIETIVAWCNKQNQRTKDIQTVLMNVVEEVNK